MFGDPAVADCADVNATVASGRSQHSTYQIGADTGQREDDECVSHGIGASRVRSDSSMRTSDAEFKHNLSSNAENPTADGRIPGSHPPTLDAGTGIK